MPLRFPELQRILGVVGAPMVLPSLHLSVEGLVRPQIVGSGTFLTISGSFPPGEGVEAIIPIDGVYACRWSVVRVAGTVIKWAAQLRDTQPTDVVSIEMRATGADQILEEFYVTYLPAGWQVRIESKESLIVGDSYLVRAFAQLLIM